MGQLQEQIVPG